MIERQELHCHNCDQYVQFNLDLELNGKHILNWPKCSENITDALVELLLWVK